MLNLLLLSFTFNDFFFRQLFPGINLFFQSRLDDKLIYFILHLEQVVEMLTLVVQFFIITEKRQLIICQLIFNLTRVDFGVCLILLVYLAEKL